MMGNAWSQRVASYLDRTEQVASTIEAILDQTPLESPADDAGKVQASTKELEQALSELELRVAEREELLRAPDAPDAGTTLADKLRATGDDLDSAMATRCHRIAGQIELTHHQALSVFVCQYHLAELSTDLVRLMVGASVPATYGESNHPANSGGGLFNESA